MPDQAPLRLSIQVWSGLLGLGVALWLVITHAQVISDMLVIVFGAVLLTLAIRPVADVLSRRQIPRSLAVAGIYVGLIALLILIGSLIVPMIRSEVTYLQSQEPALVQQALARLASIPVVERLLPSGATLEQELAQSLDTLLSAILSALTGVGGGVLDLVIVFVLAYFFATDVRISERVLSRWVPGDHQRRVRTIIAHLGHRLSRWVRAQLGIAAYFGTVFGLVLALLGVPFALTIGLVGGVLEIVPYLGGATALTLALFSALTVRPLPAVWVVLAFVVIIEVEVHVLAPTLFGRVTGLHPAAILFALVVGIKVAGIVGVFSAVPTAVVFLTFLDEIQAVRGGAPVEAGEGSRTVRPPE